MDDGYDFYLDSIRNLTEKMNPADYLYLSEKIWEFQDRIDEIKKR
jgi:hypothetical protein